MLLILNKRLYSHQCFDNTLLLTLNKSKKLIVIFMTLNKSKIKLTTKLPWEKLDAWAFLATTSYHQHSTLASQTRESLHQLWALMGFFFWTLRHPVFWFISLFLTQSVRLPLVTYPSLSSTYVTYRTPCHANCHQALPTQSLT